ncbi:MAG: hypothetical protein ACRC8S_14125 [Fimbriiglobus sp.]
MNRCIKASFLALILLALGCSQQPASSVPSPQTNTNGTGASAAPKPAVPDEETHQVLNPKYDFWAKHKPGTRVIFQETTVNPNKEKSTIQTAYLLKKVEAASLVVEVTSEIKAPDGTIVPSGALEMVIQRNAIVPKKRTAADLGKPEGTVSEKDDTITVLGVKYPAKLYRSKGRVEAGETMTETWIVEGIPGGIAKSVQTVVPTQRTVTGEITAIQKP